ncbi:MAG TPA: AAA family ATPase, partial [Arenimonas sp.]
RATVRAIEKRLETLAGVEKNWADVAVDMAVLDQLLKLVDLFTSGRTPSPKGVLLYGPPGTGKTLIARKLAKHAGCGFRAVTISDLKSEHVGGTGPQVKKIWQECRAIAPCILFIDECESAFAKRGGLNTDKFSEELVQTFLSEWDGFNESSGQVFVVAATNQHERIDNAMMSRFTASLLIGPPDAHGRRRILEHELGKARMGISVSETMVQETSGMAGRELHTLVAGLLAEHMGGAVSEADFLVEARKLRGKSSTAIESRLGWGDIVLPDQTREDFQSLGKELRHAEELAAMNISVPRGILVYGPPGTGKTQLARVLAQESGLSFLARSSSELKGTHIGQSAPKVREMFEQARGMAPCLVFLDEIDAIAPQRGSGDSFSDEIVAQLLQEIDGVRSTSAGKVFLLAASNHPEAIDAALLSRLDRKIELGLPDALAREAILRLQLAGKPLAFDLNEMAKQLAVNTEGLSGRDLGSLVTSASRKAVQRALRDHGDPTRLQLQPGDFVIQAE